jgi:regulator of sigma E protease
MSVIITLIIFTVIVVIHEWGHFFIAKRCNILIEEFAVGMGPKLFGIQRGDTLYSVRLFPVGGYCRMADEKVEGSDKIGFNDANVWQRIAVAVAGPVMNFVLALIVLTVIALCSGIATNTVTGVMDGFPASEVDIQAGDKLVDINGTAIHIRDELDFYLSEHTGESLNITVKRDGKKHSVNITPRLDEESGRMLIGIKTGYKAPAVNVGLYSSDMLQGQTKASLLECVSYGYWDMFFLVKLTATGVVKMLTFHVSMDEISGPIGVTTVVGDAYQSTIKYGVMDTVLTMLNLVALLSANLGVINLVPIPALDGGRIFVYLIEIIRRKQLPPEKEGIINLIGFALVMGLGIFIAVHDIIKLI